MLIIDLVLLFALTLNIIVDILKIRSNRILLKHYGFECQLRQDFINRQKEINDVDSLIKKGLVKLSEDGLRYECIKDPAL